MIIKSKNPKFELRHIKMSDLQAYFECFQGKNILESLLRLPKNLAEAREKLNEKISEYTKKKPSGETFAIIIKNVFAGYIELSHLNENHAEHKCEIGYCIHPNFRGKGLATKATTLLTQYAFKKYKLKRISAMGRLKNKASARVLEKAGYKLEGVLRKNKYVNGKYLDDFIYAKIK